MERQWEVCGRLNHDDGSSRQTDNASQLTSVWHRNSAGSVITAFTYTYDDAGNRTQVVEPGPTTTYWGYDDAYRLTSERREDSSGVLYADTMTYDDVGNRLTLYNGSGITTFSYDSANQLETSNLSGTFTTYTYDNNGNLQVEHTGANRTTHTWDDENRLTRVAFPSPAPPDNVSTFNGDGQRVQIVDSQGTKKPIWDFENILLETDGSNVTQVVYTLEPAGYGNLISQRRGSTSSYYLFDALGSTRRLTNSSGTVTDSYIFKAYGETFSSSGSTTNVFRWVGELGYYYDLDRLAYYLRARPYSPRLARFLSVDPLGYSNLNLASLSLYEYAQSSPLEFTDPSGLVSSDEFAAAILGFMRRFSGRVGGRQCYQGCTRVISPPIGCVCITVCITNEVTDCCVPVREAFCCGRRKVCNILRVSGDVGLYSCTSLGGRGFSIPPFPGFQLRFVPALKRPGSLTGSIASGCPKEGHSGSFCVTASAGLATWTYGARACYDFGSGRLITQVGFGIGTGTGVSGGGEYTYTKCGFPGHCCDP